MPKGTAVVLAVTFTAAAAAIVIGYGHENDYNRLDEDERVEFLYCAEEKLAESWVKNPPKTEKAKEAPDRSKMTEEESFAQLAKDLAEMQIELQDIKKRRIEGMHACAREQHIDPATLPSP